MAKYYTDGFNIGSNPSKIGGGFTIADENGKMIHREVIKKEGFTNNEGEIRGILYLLEKAEDGDIISTDSMCCLSWVHSGKSKARPDLRDIFLKCKTLYNTKKVNLIWEGRDFNKAGWLNESEQSRYKYETQ